MIETVNDPVATLPAASAAVHVTTVSPTANVLPDAGVQLTAGEAVTASVAVAVNEITLPAGEVAIVGDRSGQGERRPRGVLHRDRERRVRRLPAASCAEHCTALLPSGKTLPLAGAQVTPTNASRLSVAVGVSKVTAAPSGPVASAV